MSRKPEAGESRGILAEIRSFVFTLAVVVFAVAFLIALFTGGLGGAEGLLSNVLGWIVELANTITETIRGALSEANQ